MTRIHHTAQASTRGRNNPCILRACTRPVSAKKNPRHLMSDRFTETSWHSVKNGSVKQSVHRGWLANQMPAACGLRPAGLCFRLVCPLPLHMRACGGCEQIDYVT